MVVVLGYSCSTEVCSVDARRRRDGLRSFVLARAIPSARIATGDVTEAVCVLACLLVLLMVCLRGVSFACRHFSLACNDAFSHVSLLVR